MARVLGIGGVFFKSNDPAALARWYADVLGIAMESWGGAFIAPDAMAAHPGAGTVFSPFASDSTYFAPSRKDFMINFAVDDLDAMVARIRAHDVEVTVSSDESNGRFAHLLDPDGTKLELWQPAPR